MFPHSTSRVLLSTVLFCLLFILSITLTGCEAIRFGNQKGKKSSVSVGNSNILQQTGLTENAVSVEIFYVKIAPQQQEILDQLWREIDEQVIDAGFRHQLRREGIRVGILGTYLSPSLRNLINFTENPTGAVTNKETGMQEISLGDLALSPDVIRHTRNLMPGMSASLPPFESTIPELSRFWVEDGKICGKTYEDARGLIRLSAKVIPGERVQFQLVPMLEYGTPQTKFRTHTHLISMETGKPRHVFEELSMSLNLLPGQWIIVGSGSQQNVGIGQHFFFREAENREQKIIAIRLVRMKNEKPRERPVLPATNSLRNETMPERM